MKARTVRRANIDELQKLRRALLIVAAYFHSGFEEDEELAYELELQVKLIDWRIGQVASRHS